VLAPNAPLIIHDGELADICRLLADFELAFVEAPARVVDLPAYYSAPLVIAGPQYLLDRVEDDAGKHPTRIVVLSSEARTLRSILRRSGVAWVVRRPVHPAALRLFILHCLYRGSDKRQNERVSIGSLVQLRRGWSRRTVLLAEISQRDCRLVTPHSCKINQQVTLQLPRRVTKQGRLQLPGRVVRIGTAKERGGRDVCLIFDHLDSHTAEQLADVIELHSAGPAIFGGALPANHHSETQPSDPETVDRDSAMDGSEAHASGEQEISAGNRRATPRHAFERRVIALGEQAARVLLGRDISLYGMRVDSSSTLAVGDELQIALHAPGQKTPLVMRAAVQRDDGERGLLLHFLDVSPEAVTCLEQILQPLPELSETSETSEAPETDAENEDGAPDFIVSEILEHCGQRSERDACEEPTPEQIEAELRETDPAAREAGRLDRPRDRRQSIQPIQPDGSRLPRRDSGPDDERVESERRGRDADRGHEDAMRANNLMQGFPPDAKHQVTRDNFCDSPFNRWGYLNINRLVPTAAVQRGANRFTPLVHAPREVLEISFEGQNGRPMTVGQMIEEGFTDGFVVMHDGRIIFEHYDNGLKPSQPHLLMSLTKSFAGSLCGILVERGEVDPNAPITDYVPELADSAYGGGATLRQLLDMTVGIRFAEDYEDPETESGLLDRACGWRPHPGDDTPDNLRDLLTSLEPEGEHGRAFHYVSANSDALGWVLERASGCDFAELLSREIWRPMGAEFPAYLMLDRLGAPLVDGGLCVTLRDLARFGQLHLQRGTMNGRQIIPTAWFTDTLANTSRDAWTRGDFAGLFPEGSYRNQWYVIGDDHGSYCGIGINGQVVYIDPLAKMVIAKLSTHPQADDSSLFEDSIRAFSAIGSALAPAEDENAKETAGSAGSETRSLRGEEACSG